MKNKKWLHIITVAVILGFAVLALGCGSSEPATRSGSAEQSGGGDGGGGGFFGIGGGGGGGGSGSGGSGGAASSLFDAQNEPK
ncbi:hypothetical protein FACS1894200_14040 [Spirochaetia bacterium]|nr:hypothetical protein FACS1894200_14040 [Spirochaetia bacterium]